MSLFDPFRVSLSGNQLIEAAAGTGKTYTLAALYVRLILEGYTVREILVVTFTEAAAAELKDRLRKRLREALTAFQTEKAKEKDVFLENLLAMASAENRKSAERLLMAALGGFDEAAVFTIHGFCLRALQENAFESGVLFDTELSADFSPVYRDIAADYWALQVYHLPIPWVRLLADHRISVDFLAALLKKTAGNPDRLILPAPDPGALETSGFGPLYRETRGVFFGERDAIQRLLENHDGVNRRSYSKRTLPQWLSAVEDYLTPEEPVGFPGDGDLGKFTRSRLQETSAGAKNPGHPPEHRFFDLCDALFSLGGPWVLQFQRHFLEYGREALTRRKQELNVRFFDDLILDLDRGLKGPMGENLAEKIRGRYKAALIDEFQDTDLAQYRIFRTIYAPESCPFIMVGDPKQAIYAFRGADVFAYLQASSDAGGNRHTLEVNFRSDPAMVRAVNTIFDPARTVTPFGVEKIDFKPVSPRPGATDRLRLKGEPVPPFRFLCFRPEEDDGGAMGKGDVKRKLPDLVAGDILGLLSEGSILDPDRQVLLPVLPGDIAVLVRTNEQGRQVQAALRKTGIPSVLASQGSVFDTAEAAELHHVLAAVAAPTDRGRIATALATDLLGVPGERLDAFSEGDEGGGLWAARFREWRKLWQDAGFIQMITRVYHGMLPEGAHSPLTRLLTLTDGERRVTNFQHLAELLQTAASGGHLGPDGLLRWLAREREGTGEAGDAAQLRLESDSKAIRIVTIHKSKGMEYPVVYLPYLWDGGLRSGDKPPADCHLPDDHFRPVLDLGSPSVDVHLALARDEQMQENLRLLYVALTRARHACRVVWGKISGMETSALGYLLHRPEGPGDFKSIADHIKLLDESAIQRDLERLADASSGAVEMRDLAAPAPGRYAPPAQEEKELSCRAVTRTPEVAWRIESFSRLVSEGNTTPEEEDGLDYDQRLPEGERGITPETVLPETVPLASFGKGAEAGTFFHDIYEHLDFTESDPEAMKKIVAEKLVSHGFDASAWTETVFEGILETLECELSTDLPGFTLRKLPRDNRLDELAFMFPGADPDDSKAHAATPNRLKKIFETFKSPAVPEEYARKVGSLRFSAIRGFIKGFMDMVFEYEGKWYLVDYKSNHLGETFGDYTVEAITLEMGHHHYFLQYHLYLAALDKYLSYRIPDYDYDTHFGGVYYLFIRGMSGKTGHNYGVFYDRPEKEMVASLQEVFGGV